MRLQHDGSGAHDFSPLASRISWCANAIEPTMRGRECFAMRKRALPRGGPRPIHIYDQPLLSRSIQHPAWGRERGTGEQIVLKELAECFHTGWIKGGQKAGKS